MEFFCNTKDRTVIINQSFAVYKFTCPGRGANYVGKTERTLYERMLNTRGVIKILLLKITLTSVLKCSTY